MSSRTACLTMAAIMLELKLKQEVINVVLVTDSVLQDLLEHPWSLRTISSL
ncbi:unnamed protein product [Angiostrongylus costaricensis]|uniref:RNase H domain-containing protein n=1 Tax=Angiostrongylus costaricensis TaxID=334426 RepID=A0A0R3PHZ5_ANGCS|nr:unnamed protein product [Angiostrongylus costaricensis]